MLAVGSIEKCMLTGHCAAKKLPLTNFHMYFCIVIKEYESSIFQKKNSTYFIKLRKRRIKPQTLYTCTRNYSLWSDKESRGASPRYQATPAYHSRV